MKMDFLGSIVTFSNYDVVIINGLDVNFVNICILLYSFIVVGLCGNVVRKVPIAIFREFRVDSIKV